MKASGLKVNENKTEICLFSRSDVASLNIVIKGVNVTISREINVLGVVFDAKLQWGPQVKRALTRATKALNAISLIRMHFSQQELLLLVTSNYYSVLYYNSEVWHLPTLNQSLKKALITSSARALKMCAKSSDMWMLSYKSLHEMTGRSRPQEIMNYKLALQLYKTINNQTPSRDWVNLNFKTILTSRTTTFSINKSNQRRVGMNILSNRFWYLNGKIKLDWMNLSFDTFKIKCKKLLL